MNQFIMKTWNPNYSFIIAAFKYIREKFAVTKRKNRLILVVRDFMFTSKVTETMMYICKDVENLNMKIIINFT